MRNSLLYIILISFLLINLSVAGDGDKNRRKILTNDDYKYIARNDILMWFSNNGDGSHDPYTDGNGFFWPGGKNATKSAVFEDGLVFSGKIGDEIRANGNTHRQGLQAGKIINGIPDDPSLPKYRIYRYYKNWQTLPPGEERTAYETDYNQWPWEDGAPWKDVNLDSVYTPGVDYPEYYGDEFGWYVANDMDSSRSTFTYGTLPMGIEFQTTVFTFNLSLYNDMIFKRYLMINKGQNTIDSMFVGYWADVDLGDASDDYVGCDTVLNLGYSYNSDNNDGVYGNAPPAIGYDFLQRPVVPGNPGDSARFLDGWKKGYKNLDMTAFILYPKLGYPAFNDPWQGVAQGSVQFFNYMRGHDLFGNVIKNPDSVITKFMVPGDPVNGSGWYEGQGWPNGPAPSDRRHLLSSGPFTFAPGDTQDLIIGIAIAKGTDNINSITELKNLDIHMERLYYYNFNPSIVSVKDDPATPDKFLLLQNFPNPFNPSTVIKYRIPESGKVSMKIFNIIGREITTLVNEYKTAGNYEVNFNAEKLPAGVYFCSLNANDKTSVIKMILLK